MVVETLGDRWYLKHSCVASCCCVLTFVLDERLQLLLQAVVPACDVQMKREVAARLLLGQLPPLLKR